MVNQQLIDYIKQQLQRNVTGDEIKQTLLAKGWAKADIEETFTSLGYVNQVRIPAKPEPGLASLAPTSLTVAKIANNKINKKLIAIIASAVVVLLLLIGGGVLAYNYYFPAPEKVLQKMLANLTTIKSLEYTGEVKTGFKNKINFNGLALPTIEAGSGDKINNLIISFNGLSEIKKDPNAVLSLNFKTDALSQGENSLGLDIRIINKVMYFSLTQIPNLGSFKTESLKNQWIKIDIESFKNQFGEKLSKQIEEYQAKGDLSADKLSRIKAVWQKFKIIKITDKLQSEKINDVDTYHYKFEIDQAELKQALIETMPIILDKPLTEKELADFNKGFDDTMAKAKSALVSSNSEIWIGKKDFLPYKIYLDSVIKDSKEIVNSGKSSLTLTFKNFNQPVKVEVPEARPINQVLSEIFSKFKNPATNLSDEVVVDTDKDGLADQYEVVYGTDINKADTDGDGYSDYDEVKNGYNPNGQGKLPKGMPSFDYLLPKNGGKVDQGDFQLNKNTVSQRDAQRLVDINEIMSALKNYYNASGKYPLTSEFKVGEPIKYVNNKSSFRFNGVEQKGVTETYLQVVPSNPSPNDDGSCPAKTDYIYSANKNASSYSITFCLGGVTGDLSAGKHKATPNGFDN